MNEKGMAQRSGGYLRVAVVQLDYHPAAVRGSGDPLGDPLYRGKGAGSSLLPHGEDAAPLSLHKRWNELRGRVRSAYTAQLGQRVQAVVNACRAANVRVLVFPEYSLPPSLLPELAPLSEGLVLVAGSHFADTTSQDADVYESLGFDGDIDALQERNVSPVLYGGRLIALVPKLHPSKPERKFLSPGDAWAPVDVPTEYGGPLGVLICLDYLHRENDVADGIKGCGLLAAPTLTPEHTIGDDFQPMALRDARRFHKPVLHANDAKSGGSSVYVDEGRREDVRRFPHHVGMLEAGEEGIIIADIDIQGKPPGESTGFDTVLPVVPHAAASLVYSGIEREYAAWQAELRAILDDDKVAVRHRIKAAREMIQRSAPPLPAPGTARYRRLTLLLQDIAEISSLERLRRLTREIVLPESVLPLKAVRAALARGAADAVHKWVENPSLGAGAFGPVSQTLRSAWLLEEKALAGCSVTARRALDEVSDIVRGGRAPVPRERQELRVMAYEQVLVDVLNEDAKEALSLLKGGRHAEGREKFRALLTTVERAAADEPSEELRKKIAIYRLHIATATLNLQEAEAARELLLSIEPGDLAPKDRLTLVEALAVLGEQTRAEALLPAEEDIEPAERHRHLETVQLLAITRGELPDTLVGSAPIRVNAAFLALSKKDAARAAKEALSAISEAEGPLSVAQGVGLLVSALKSTVNEIPAGVIPIPIEERTAVVETIETRLPEVKAASLPEPIQRMISWMEPSFQALIRDDEALAKAPDPRDIKSPEDEEESAFYAVHDRVSELLKERKPAEAIALLPPDDHPWRGHLYRIDIWRSGGEPSRALEEVLELVRDFPDKAPVEYSAADQLLRAGRWDEALRHAERAFTLLPGIGQRTLFAQALLAVGQAERAWELLQPLRASDRLAALRMLAQAADESRRPTEAVAFFRKLVERQPDDVHSRLILAQRLSFLYHHEEAADVAWRTLESHYQRLDIQGLHFCGGLQQFPGADPKIVEKRINRAAEILFERFPGDPRAEQARMSLHLRIGKLPEGPQAINFDRLVEAGYAYRGEGMEELAGWLRQRRQLEASVQRLAQWGSIPAWAVCRELGVELPLLLTRLLVHRRTLPLPVWCPPIRRAEQRPQDNLRSATLLLSDLEITLLHALDRSLGTRLWDSLHEQLAGGALILPAPAHQRLLIAAGKSMSTHRRKPDEHNRWIELMERYPCPAKLSPEEDDEAVAARLGIPILDTDVREGVKRLSPRALLTTLRDKGVLDETQEQAILKMLPEEKGAAETLSDPLPRALLGGVLLRPLLEVGVLEQVAIAFRGALSVGPVAIAALREERRDLDERVRAAELGDTVHKAVAAAQEAGWLRVVTLDEPSVPLLREGAPEIMRSMVREPTCEAVAIHELLEKHPSWLRVTADFFGERVTATPGTIELLSWDSESFGRISERLHRVEPRTLSFPGLIRAMVTDLRERDNVLQVLAELGFADALGAIDMLNLARRYGGLDKAEPTRLLDRQEWVMRSPEHPGWHWAHFCLAQTYGDVLVRTVLTADDKHTTDRSEAEKQAVVRATLSRLERLATDAHSDLMAETLEFVAMATMSRFQSSWKADEEEDKAVIDQQSPLALLWRTIADWADADPGRRGAFGRAVRDIWALMADSYEEPGDIQIATLHEVVGSRLGRSQKGAYLMQPEVEPLAIFSGLWREARSLALEGNEVTDPRTQQRFAITNEVVLKHGARLLDEPEKRYVNARSMAFEIPVADTGGVFRTQAPIEALFLRAESPVRKKVAGVLKALQGPHDGELYSLIEAIENDPDNRAYLLNYAKRASRALFRLVRDDPTYLEKWPGTHSVLESGVVPDLDALRAILSEPAELPPVDQPPVKWLGKRVMGGEWSRRSDQGELLFRASEIPGLLPATTIQFYFDQPSYDDHVEAALDCLESSDDEPIARVVRDILFLRVASARRPTVRLPQGEVDLREILPSRFAKLLIAVRADPKPDTMAACEGPLLRLCGGVVVRLARYTQLPDRDRLWLTYRLFQWLCAQLESLSPDARMDAYRRLTALDPPAHETTDILDPFGFDRARFDHRLAAVLHALTSMEELPRVFQRQRPDGSETGSEGRPPEIRSVSSPELEDHLVQIAQGVAQPGPTTSVLDWKSLGNAPDLALLALLTLNATALARVSPEARTRRWEALPLDPKGDSVTFIWRLISAIADQAGALTSDERNAIEQRLRAMVDSETSRQWRWIVWVGLFAAGADHLEAEARSLTEEHIATPLAPLLAGRLLVALTSTAPDRLEKEVEALRASAEKAGADIVDVVVAAVVRVAVHGAPEAKQAAFTLLRRLAQEPPFKDNPGMRNVIGFFHLAEPAA